ncbi:hypothetical protein MFLAVUS_001675 [Mucor flavus]|uniref:Uncharacterized protein n=1 Tax=Mucor flavus TaxID=439312 RepID=A0ABP9YN52_9FUNG
MMRMNDVVSAFLFDIFILHEYPDLHITSTEITSTPYSEIKVISLSRSRNKLPEPATEEPPYIPYAEGSGTSRLLPMYIKSTSHSNIALDAQDAFDVSISQDRQHYGGTYVLSAQYESVLQDELSFIRHSFVPLYRGQYIPPSPDREYSSIEDPQNLQKQYFLFERESKMIAKSDDSKLEHISQLTLATGDETPTDNITGWKRLFDVFCALLDGMMSAVAFVIVHSFQNNVVKWPYANNSKYAKTESFAKAGFYFVRRPKASDSVRCFICDIELSHWRPNQSPFVRHGNESPHCAWKRLNFPDAHKKPLSDPSKAYDRPRSIGMRSVRLATFNCHNYWPPKKGTTKYPTAAKLASAGFYFTPTTTLSSRVKCAYCGESVTVNPNDTDLLNKHKELSTGCAFFEETHSTRNSRSTRSSSIKSADRSVKGDESDTDSSTCKRPINKVSTSSETSAPISKRSKEQNKASEPAASKKRTYGKEPAVSNKTKGVQKEALNTDDSVWDINQILTPPKPTRRAIITYGSSRPVRHLPLSSRNNPSGVDILPDFKSSLIIKPNGPYITSPATTPVDNTKKVPQASTKPKVIQRRRLRQPEASGSGTSVSAVLNETNPPKKRSLSISSSTDNTPPPSKKSVSKRPIDTTEITSTPSKVIRDKGKGRAVEYNLPSSFPIKKAISLSRSRNKLPETATSFISKEPAAEGSGTSCQHLVNTEPDQATRNISPSNISNDTQDVSSMDQDPPKVPPTITQDTTEVSNLPTVKDTQFVSTSPMPQDITDVSTLPTTQDMQYVFDLPIYQDTEDELCHVLNPPSPVYNHNEIFVDKENIPPPISYSPIRENATVYNDQRDEENPLTPVYYPLSPSMHINNYSPEPGLPYSYTPSPPPHPSAFSAVTSMSFLQSTPSDNQNRLANAIDIFGAAPLSPILPPHSNTLGGLQYTPAMTEGRVGRIITQDEEGISRIVRAEKEPSEAGLLSDCLLRNQNMTVEEHWHSLVDASVERLQEICDSDIRKIEEKFNLTRSRLEKDL